MPDILIRRVSARTKERLKQHAKRHGKSPEADLRETLDLIAVSPTHPVIRRESGTHGSRTPRSCQEQREAAASNARRAPGSSDCGHRPRERMPTRNAPHRGFPRLGDRPHRPVVRVAPTAE
ncbi:FitA-like ribbon-helix-helix domain-containing protein [Reyranella sp.]|uniref:FitA-like ribbon-helix-helix domain-containing protein n=1 Tax=Reyranella sp. TaxID=1929291 RepID=UPI003D0E065A